MALLDSAKLALRLTVDDYDTEITRLISAAIGDLWVAGIEATTDTTDANITQAIITYCRANFGTPDDYDRIKASYDEQKAQMQMARGYGLPGQREEGSENGAG